MKKRGSRLKNWFKRKFASQKPETRETERTASMAQVKEFKHTSSIAMNNGLVEMENVPTHIKQRAYEAMKVQKAMLKGGVRNSDIEDPETIRRLVELLQKPESYSEINKQGAEILQRRKTRKSTKKKKKSKEEEATVEPFSGASTDSPHN